VLLKNGIDRSRLYITSVVKQPTPANRKPTMQEIGYWMPFLTEEIKRVKPRVIFLMGEVARRTPRFEGIRYIETYHPAAAMRFPKARERFERDVQEIRD
jgi:uracil-DNA glycosylase